VTASKKVTPRSASAEDARVAKLLRALRDDPGLAVVVREFEEMTRSAGGGRRFGSNGLKASGKLFALFTQGTLVVKLPKARVADLVVEKVGKPFDPGHGRLMKEWLAVTSATASWVDLTREAFAFVSASKR
jgi:hypothetical protein